jgi:hypothetical protein
MGTNTSYHAPHPHPHGQVTPYERSPCGGVSMNPFYSFPGPPTTPFSPPKIVPQTLVSHPTPPPLWKVYAQQTDPNPSNHKNNKNKGK